MEEISDTDDAVTLLDKYEGIYGGCSVYKIYEDELILPN